MGVGFEGTPRSISPKNYPEGLFHRSQGIGNETTLLQEKYRWPVSQGVRESTENDLSMVSWNIGFWNTSDGIAEYFAPTNKIYIFGGYVYSHGYGTNSHDMMWEFDVETHELRTLDLQHTLYGGGPRALIKASPAHRYDHGSCVYGNKIWIFGGRSWNGDVYGDLWCYDPYTGLWEQKAVNSYAPSRADFGRKLVVIGNKFYVFGGQGEDAGTLSSMWSYNFTTDTWQEEAPGPGAPSGRYGHQCWGHGGRYWMMGGYDDKSEVWSFDPAGGTKWQQSTSFGTGKHEGTAHYHSGLQKAYIAGDGYTFSRDMVTGDLNRYLEPNYGGSNDDNNKGQIETLVESMDRIYSFGGYLFTWGSYPTSWIRYYDIKADRWIGINEEIYSGRSDHGMTYHRSKVYMYGGIYRSPNSSGPWDSIQTLYEFNPTRRITRFLTGEQRNRRSFDMWGYGDHIFNFMGNDGVHTLSSVSAFNLVTEEWENRESCPVDIDNYCSVKYNGKVWVYGGGRTDFAYNRRLFAYDLEADTWTEYATGPANRGIWAGAMWACNNKLFVCLGYYTGGSWYASSNILVYNMGTNTWVEQTATAGSATGMPSSRYKVHYWGYHHNLYIGNGYSGSVNSDSWRLDCQELKWYKTASMHRGTYAASRGASDGGETPVLFMSGNYDTQNYPNDERMFACNAVRYLSPKAAINETLRGRP